MNRKEISLMLENYINDCLKSHEYNVDSGFGEMSYNHQKLETILNYLQQPITLADLLRWEEGVEYDYKDLYVLKVKNNRLFMKSEKCSSGWCDFALFTDEIEELQQATKVKKKLKAYHVKDEYSYNCLMKELEEKGYMWGSGNSPTKWSIKNSLFFYGWEVFITTDYKKRLFYGRDKVSSNYELIEYYKEEPKFYAKIKGWELLRNKEAKGSDCGGKWFIYAPRVKEITTVSRYKDLNDEWIASMTKTEWNELGINDTNADFDEVQ